MLFRTVTLAVLTMVIAVGGLSFASEDGPRKHGDRHKRMLEKYDANKDGKLDDQEKESVKKARAERREKMRKRMLEKYDANKDGKLDDDEKQAMKKARAERRAHIFEKYDANKDGKLDDDEKAAMREGFAAQMIERCDKNDDGKMDADEVPQRHRDRFGETDTNDDGYVDLEELKVAMAKRHKHRKRPSDKERCPVRAKNEDK